MESSQYRSLSRNDFVPVHENVDLLYLSKVENTCYAIFNAVSYELLGNYMQDCLIFI